MPIPSLGLDACSCLCKALDYAPLRHLPPNRGVNRPLHARNKRSKELH